jgi:hypothetical protein
MMRHSGTAVLRQIVCTLMLALQITGCTSWRAQQPSPAGLLGDKPPHQVRITLADGRKITVTSPRLSADTLRGQSGRDSVRFSVADIRGVAVPHTNAAATAALTVGVVLLIGVAAAAAAISSWDGPFAHWGQ